MAKLKVLGLHGFRTSAEILKRQTAKWDDRILERLDIHFVDGPFPAQGKSDVEEFFPPPYFEWFHIDEHRQFSNIDEGIAYIEDYMLQHGPFHGFLGFSQGAILSAALAGLQQKGLALSVVPPISFVIIVSGAKFRETDSAPNYSPSSAYSSPIDCPSLHVLGEKDFLKPGGEELLQSFVKPVVIRHPVGHTVPRLEEEGAEIFMSFLDTVEEVVKLRESRNEVTERQEQMVEGSIMSNGMQDVYYGF